MNDSEQDASRLRMPAVGELVALEGVTPPRQARSGATFRALIKAGRNALKAGSLDAMTIDDIAHAAKASVGAFYGRFENKEAFFAAIQQITVADIWKRMQALINGLKARDASALEFLEAIGRFWVEIFRENRGLYVATFKHASTRPGAWTPFKRLGWNGSDLIAEALVPRLECENAELQVRLAMQFVNGLLVNATINDPGPVQLDDPAMEGHVTRFLCLFLGVQCSATTVRSRRTTREHR